MLRNFGSQFAHYLGMSDKQEAYQEVRMKIIKIGVDDLQSPGQKTRGRVSTCGQNIDNLAS